MERYRVMMVICPSGMNPHYGMASVLSYGSEEEARNAANRLGLGLPIYGVSDYQMGRMYPSLTIAVER